ncbi:hypothetical protein BGZ83_006830 [Gryganskiella cystojenkinii]|nr:hypothetical protein BGZ83_006830 [Gryganskiella cystojenkinii]
MASFSDLPLECLQQILQVFQDRIDTVTLGRLVQVNHYFCSITIPYLYQRVFDHQYLKDGALVHPHLVKVIQTLLYQRPRTDVHGFLAVACDLYPHQDPNPAPPEKQEKAATILTTTTANPKDLANDAVPRTSKINYLSFIRHFNFEQVVYVPQYTETGESAFDPEETYPKRTWEYVFSNNKEDKPANEIGEGFSDKSLMFPPTIMIDKEPHTTLRYTAFASTLRRDLTWVLCSPVLEQIQSINIPLSDIDLYYTNVGRFQSLTSVTFIQDEMMDPPAEGLDSDVMAKEENQKAFDICKKERFRKLRGMVCFVTKHGELFPNKLQLAECPSDCSWTRWLHCPGEFLSRFASDLPPIQSPRAIDVLNYIRISYKIEFTDLSQVTRIQLLRSHFVACLRIGDPGFPSRCRSLKSLDICDMGRGAFRWAVREKKAWDRFHAGVAASGADEEGITESVLMSPRPPLPLVPLETVNMAFKSVLGNELNDITYAFSESLKVLRVSQPSSEQDEVPSSDTATTIESSSLIGKDWPLLPKLTTLWVAMDSRLWIDPDLFTNILKADQIEHVWLTDKSGVYRHQDVVYGRAPLEIWSKAHNITLEGYPCLWFHPDTLYKTPNLRRLQLNMYTRVSPLYTAPVEEILASFQAEAMTTKSETAMNMDNGDDDLTESTTSSTVLTSPADHCHRHRCSRPRWTWDWDLPKLTYLRLDSEFAFLFEFRVLVGCPSLRSLSLDIRADTEHLKRVLTLQDFVRPDDSFLFSTHSIASGSGPSANIDAGVASSRVKDEGAHSIQPLIVAPSLLNLSLFGPWILSDKVRAQVFATTFPVISQLIEMQRSGHTVQGWIATVSDDRLSNLKDAYCGLGVTHEDLKALGLEPRRTEPVVVNGKREKLYFFNGHPWSFPLPST